MNKCPKCECIRVTGPKYEHTWSGEKLRYTCARCGYSMTTPTLDQD